MAEGKHTFETLKGVCPEVPALAFADFGKPFLLDPDPSKSGLGAVLSQNRLMVDTTQ